jgi:hypothetical protein
MHVAMGLVVEVFMQRFRAMGWTAFVATIATLTLGGACAVPPQQPPSMKTETQGVYFDPDIQSAMDVLGCSAGDCHGSGKIPMHVVPPASGGSVDKNYTEVRPRGMGGTSALLLLKPVDGTGAPHTGGKFFAVGSPTYQQWLDWVQNGTPFRATGAPPTPSAPMQDAEAPPTPPPTTSDAGSIDAGATPPPSVDAGGGDGGAPDAAVACTPVQSVLSSSHNAGRECLGCHAAIANPTLRWTVAGTVWSDSFGSSPRAGATITVVDSANQTLTLVSDVLGNFYTSKPVQPPLHARGSACPSAMSMQTVVQTGSCNSTSCHDASRPMALP